MGGYVDFVFVFFFCCLFLGYFNVLCIFFFNVLYKIIEHLM